MKHLYSLLPMSAFPIPSPDDGGGDFFFCFSLDSISAAAAAFPPPIINGGYLQRHVINIYANISQCACTVN